MLLKSLSLLLAPLPLVLAQYGAPADPAPTTAAAVSTASSASAAPASTAASSVAGVHVVTVGANSQLAFVPNTTTAAVGEKIEFHFFAPTHSVVQGSFDNPCQPIGPNAFFSGGISTLDSNVNPITFTVTINDTNPIYFYCGFPAHCQNGMVGVINPSSSNSSRSLALYAAAAAKTTSSAGEAQPQGGILGPAAVASSASSSTSAAATPSKTGAAAVGKSQVGWMGVLAAGVAAAGVAVLLG